MRSRATSRPTSPSTRCRGGGRGGVGANPAPPGSVTPGTRPRSAIPPPPARRAPPTPSAPRRARAALGGSGLLFAYDKAERLVQAAKSPAPLAVVANNHAVPPGSLAGLPDAFAYTYDTAQNLLAKSEAANGIAKATALPLDTSG